MRENANKSAKAIGSMKKRRTLGTFDTASISEKKKKVKGTEEIRKQHVKVDIVKFNSGNSQYFVIIGNPVVDMRNTFYFI